MDRGLVFQPEAKFEVKNMFLQKGLSLSQDYGLVKLRDLSNIYKNALEKNITGMRAS